MRLIDGVPLPEPKDLITGGIADGPAPRRSVTTEQMVAAEIEILRAMGLRAMHPHDYAGARSTARRIAEIFGLTIEETP